MPTKTVYGDRKAAIHQAIVTAAKQGRRLTYGELGQQVDIPARGPWKGILDEIGREEVAAGRPDLTYLVVSSRNGLPGQIDFKPISRPPTAEQRALADKITREVWAYYRPRP